MVEEKELRGIIKMFQATAKMAEKASMTGSMADGTKYGVRQFNAVLKRLQDAETIPDGLFVPLEEDASFDDLGLCCNQLAAYLEGILVEPIGKPNTGVPLMNGPGFIKINTGSLGDIGELIRQSMPEWIRTQMDKKEEKKEDDKPKAKMNDLESRIAELGAQIQMFAERLHREEFSTDEIHKMAEQMRQLGQQQTKLAREHAVIREANNAEEKKEENES